MHVFASTACPLEFSSAPEIFQRTISAILEGLDEVISLSMEETIQDMMYVSEQFCFAFKELA